MPTQINYYNALPKSYELEEYRIESVLIHKEFHIIYLAHDMKLDVPVKIKECLPNKFAVREGNYMVQPKSQKDAEKLALCLEQFTEEARIEASNHHPNIMVRVRRLLDANNTTYIVMDMDYEEAIPPTPSNQRTAPFLLAAIVIIVALGVGNMVYINTKPVIDCDIPDTRFFSDPLQDGGCGPEMAIIPAGEFNMGKIQGGGDKDELPVHRVSLKSFAMCRYEVTFEEYDRFAEATTSIDEPDDEGWGRGKRPVINVSWHDAMAYMEWLSEQTGKNYGLPSEAQWEYAARAGTETKYWWGNTASHEYANYGADKCCRGEVLGKDRWKETSPVGSFEPNSFGLHDLVGNVWEWVADPDHDNYEDAPKDGSVWKKGEEGDSRVVRGGSWYHPPLYCRIANRHKFNSNNKRSNKVGFRCYRSVIEAQKNVH